MVVLQGCRGFCPAAVLLQSSVSALPHLGRHGRLEEHHQVLGEDEAGEHRCSRRKSTHQDLHRGRPNEWAAALEPQQEEPAPLALQHRTTIDDPPCC